MDLAGKRVLVVGLGKSGVAAARLCLARGARVSGTDRASAEQLSPEARGLGIPITPHESTDFRGQDLIVVSPGVPATFDLPLPPRLGAEVQIAPNRALGALVLEIGR